MKTFFANKHGNRRQKEECRSRWPVFTACFLFFLSLQIKQTISASDLSQLGLHVIPYPHEVYHEGEDFLFSGELTVVLNSNHSEADRFAAEELIRDLKNEWNIKGIISGKRGYKSVVLNRKAMGDKLNDQGYQLKTFGNEVIIFAEDEAGLFYGTRTFLQLIVKTTNGFRIPGLQITDWPDIKKRAVHYDTKHHQDRRSYVESFIKDLARYKINQLVWEWEDKLAYESHPEIGAPGAFTIQEMQEITRFAKNYHVEVIPLVQGLGHVSFILKWTQYKHLREIAASNWEFCPLKDESYDLLFDLWEEAIKATPGSEHIHIGSDETYELAACPDCRAKADEIGQSGLYHLFVKRATEHLQKLGRKVMVWETPMGWKKDSLQAKRVDPAMGIVLTESYNYETETYCYAKEAKTLGYEIYAYDPNPGIEPLFLPYQFRQQEKKKNVVEGCLENSYRFLTSAATSGVFDGMIRTSWDDSGLHNQMWMLCFATAAAYSWNGRQPALEEFEESFFKSYYGPSVQDLTELYFLLNEGAYYYSWTLERNVWHFGMIGKTHLPDLPRNEHIEYDPFWNAEYSEKISESEQMLEKMKRALHIIENNKKAGTRHAYDFEVYQSVAKLIEHTCLTYLDLSNLENKITRAHGQTYLDKQQAYDYLSEAAGIITASLERRRKIFDELVEIWEKIRLPKGMSTPEKNYFHQEDRARHYANRRADMSFLICDEQQLDMEGYLEQLEAYMQHYKKLWLE
ncbi:MAG: beta-N-acetylhexosaminidase [Mangrovibacterium sp.]